MMMTMMRPFHQPLASALFFAAVSCCWLSLFAKQAHAQKRINTTFGIYNLDDGFFYGQFGDFDGATLDLVADESVDFWVTDKKNFDLWLDQLTLPTVKLFESTYCQNCKSYSTVFTNPTPGSGDYYWVVSAVFPERGDVDGNLQLSMTGAQAYFNSPVVKEDETAVCFSGRATVQRRAGGQDAEVAAAEVVEQVLLRDVRVGDALLAVGVDGAVSFSPVLAVPHQRNHHYASFVQLHTHTIPVLAPAAGAGAAVLEASTPLELTRDHLVLTCPQQQYQETAAVADPTRLCISCPPPDSHLNPLTMLTAAKDVTVSMCVLRASASTTATAKSHWVPVTAITKRASRNGLYTVVTKAAYPVVSGVVASPFAVSHILGHSFYAYLKPLVFSMLRALGISSADQLQNDNSMADGFASVINTPALNRAVKQLTSGFRLASSLLAEEL